MMKRNKRFNLQLNLLGHDLEKALEIAGTPNLNLGTR
jgi:hypothetical protein